MFQITPPKSKMTARGGGVATTWPLPDAGTHVPPVRVPVRLVRLLRGGHRNPPAMLHARLVELAALRARGVVAAEVFRRVLFVDLHPLALVGRAARQRQRHHQPETDQARRGSHSAALYRVF